MLFLLNFDILNIDILNFFCYFDIPPNHLAFFLCLVTEVTWSICVNESRIPWFSFTSCL